MSDGTGTNDRNIGINDLPVGWGPGKVVASERLRSALAGEGGSQVGYDDVLVAPPLGVDTVQAAIDVIKGSTGGPVLDNVFKIESATDTTRYVNWDVQGSAGIHGTFRTAPTSNQVWAFPDVTGDVLVAIQTAGANFGIVFINQTVKDHGSNAGLQYTSDVANRAQFRGNQYGNNAGIPGMTAFKSRGPIGGPDLPVNVGDVIWRATAIGITANLTFPLSGLVSVVVESVPVGQSYIGTGYEVRLVPDTGPANGHKQAFYVTGNGIVRYKEVANGMAGVVATGAGGTAIVANNQVSATSRIVLTIQDGGAVPTAAVYVAARVVGVSFTIQSLAAGDVGVNVYYQIYEPTSLV